MEFKRPGTPQEYAEAFRQELLAGITLDELNDINHDALKRRLIGYEHFKAAAEVLKREILRR